MLLKSLTLVCLVGCVLAQNTTVHPCDVLIPRGSSGFANDPSGCSRYYSCNFGVFTSVSCPLGFHFAEDIQSCIPEKYSECRVCSGNGTSQV